MKAKVFLEWICRENIRGELMGMIDVPKEGDHEWEQNEDWWYDHFGMTPPAPIAEGEYLYFYVTQVDCDVTTDDGVIVEPDAQIELCNMDNMYGCDYINLYKIND